jgi:hypothetical protein
MSPSREWGPLKRLFYYAVTAAVAVAVAEVYFLWLEHYNTLHPELVQAAAMGYVEELPLEGALIWDEQLVIAPEDGVLTYPSPLPRRVAKGEAVAAVDGAPVRAKTPGYFFPALDGQETQWTYLKLWAGTSQFPAAGEAKLIENGKSLRRGDAVGKFVPQPQDLRCIAYLDKTPSLVWDIRRGFIQIRTEPAGKSWRVAVRTSFIIGQKIKLYLTLPFFPPSLLRSRFFSCSVLTGNRQGFSVPESSVVLRDGKLWVLLVQGSVAKFTEIEGFPADGENFFVTKGLVSGHVVVRYAERGREGAIRPW